MSAKTLDQHIFAFYFKEILVFKNNINKNIIVEDTQLHHRLTRVLRFSSGSTCILFDRNYHVTITIQQVFKKSIEFFVESFSQNKPLFGQIVLLLPVLKREALAQAVYAAVETGVTEIQLITTQKVQRNWGGNQELTRLQNVIIAACEQAKYFTIPDLKAPISLEQALLSVQNDATRIFFDSEGFSFSDLSLISGKPITVLIGPEGDLTPTEKNIVKNHAFKAVRLTPTVLRAPQAVTVGIGLLRTII